MKATIKDVCPFNSETTLWPDPESFAVLLGRGFNQIPLIKRLPLGEHTPQSLIGFFEGADRILLESTHVSRDDGRYSIIVGEPLKTLVAKCGHIEIDGLAHMGNPLKILQQVLADYRGYRPEGAPLFCGGAVGFLAYESNHYLERLPQNGGDDLQIPDLCFLLVNRCLVVDHLSHSLLVIASTDDYQEGLEGLAELEKRLSTLTPLLPIQPSWLAVSEKARYTSNIRPDDYMDRVRKVQEYIALGDTYQLNLSQRLRVATRWEPFQLYRRLSALNPVHFAGFLDLKGFQIVGASPERLARLDSGRLTSRPIAGTRRRGTPEEDERFIQELKTDEKELAEHAMLVDLVRNDLGQVCRYGSVSVVKLMDIVKYASVIHIESLVEGLLDPHQHSLTALTATFPGGTVTGVPKVRTMEIIAELEPNVRSLYTGAIGYFSFAQEMDFNMVIRNIILKDEMAYVNVGGGVVYDSDPYREYKETLNKARGQLEALAPLPAGKLP